MIRKTTMTAMMALTTKLSITTHIITMSIIAMKTSRITMTMKNKNKTMMILIETIITMIIL